MLMFDFLILVGRNKLEKKRQEQEKMAKMAKKLTTASSGHFSVCLYKETLTINNKAQLQTHKATLSYIMQGKHLW